MLGLVAVASAQFNVHRPFQSVPRAVPPHQTVVAQQPLGHQPLVGHQPVVAHQPAVVHQPVVAHQPHQHVVPGQRLHSGIAPAQVVQQLMHVEPNVDNQAQVLRSDVVVNPDSYQYEYETSNGIVANEAGQLKQFSDDEAAIVSQGAFRYNAPDGTPIALQYTADENGFHPVGDHLPVSPPLPDHIGT